MEELIAYRVDLLGALDDVVGELTTEVAEKTPESLLQPVDTGTNTPHYHLFRLRELEKQVFALQLPRFLAESKPFLAVFDDKAWMRQHYRADEPAQAILDELARLRHHELAWLRTLSPADWSRLARHQWWGLHALQWWVELQLDWSYQCLKQLHRSMRDENF